MKREKLRKVGSMNAEWVSTKKENGVSRILKREINMRVSSILEPTQMEGRKLESLGEPVGRWEEHQTYRRRNERKQWNLFLRGRARPHPHLGTKQREVMSGKSAKARMPKGKIRHANDAAARLPVKKTGSAITLEKWGHAQRDYKGTGKGRGGGGM